MRTACAGRLLQAPENAGIFCAMTMQGSCDGLAEETATGLILPGGGARGAYQVGVLKAIAEIMPLGANPFPVICGTSAGAINAAVLASHAHEFSVGIERLEHFWASMFCARVYRTDAWTVLRSALHWALSLGLGTRLRSQPKSLLDNTPLREFLERTLRLHGIEEAIGRGALRGVSVVTSAGNERNNSEWGRILAPADGFNVIAVGGVDQGGFVTWVSSPGPTADGRVKPDVMARAFGNIVPFTLRDDIYVQTQGVDAAVPLVAGAVALLREQWPELNPVSYTHLRAHETS